MAVKSESFRKRQEEAGALGGEHFGAFGWRFHHTGFILGSLGVTVVKVEHVTLEGFILLAGNGEPSGW